MCAEVRVAIRAAGVDMDAAAANEAMARAFKDCEAEELPLMAVRRGPHDLEVATFRMEPHLY